jgi:hypothetical protein
MFAEMLDNFKHLTWLISESRSLAAKMTTEEICSAADKENKAADSEGEVNEESQIPSLGEAVSGFEVV